MKAGRLQHVSVPYERGREAGARAFYGELLGLAELPPPRTLTGVIWYRVGEAELHLFADEVGAEEAGGARGRHHFCLDWGEREALERLRRRLEGAGVATQDTTPIPGRPRFFCRDPFGNRLELTATAGDPLDGSG